MTVELQDLPTPGETPERAADAFVTGLGFKPIGKAWRRIERSEALDTMTRILFCDLAYQHPLMDQKTARFIAESFLGLFSPFGGEFCTNGALDERSWTPITESTFDRGIVALDDKRVGIVWVQDED